MVATRRTKAAASPKPPGPTRAASPTPNAAVLAAAAADDPSVADGAAAPDAAAPEEPDRTPGMLALWRALFYSLMCAQWYRGHIAHYVVDYPPEAGARLGADAFFAYDQWEGLVATLPRTAAGVQRLKDVGLACGAAAAAGAAFPAAAAAFDAARTSTAGPGRPDQTLTFSRSATSTSIRLMLGRIDRSRRGVHRGVPWAAMEATLGPRLFAAVALGGLLLDGSMAAALLCLRPSRESFAAFAALSCAFHGFTCFTMSQRIGYAFPGACVCAVVLFAPVGGPGGDAPLHAWLARAATGFSAGEPRRRGARPARPLRCLLLLYVLLQVLVPLRMPLLHGADFAMSARGYRFSWTMMLHGKDQGARGAMSFLKFAYLAPSVAGTLFERLNGRGPFARVIDPTVDLVAADDRRRARAPWEIFRDVVMDRLDDEFILRGSGASDLSDRAGAGAARCREGQAGYMGAPVAVLVDRSPCLAASPLILSPLSNLARLPLAAAARRRRGTRARRDQLQGLRSRPVSTRFG
ncbi:hypothetical protein JL722_7967 [Aureococcus anophagefferens]|nr:hypothetical protein JL722_7967 [Aureococcus anophagefferens]